MIFCEYNIVIMKNFLRYILILVMAGVVTTFLVLTSFGINSGIAKEDSKMNNPTEILFSVPTITETGSVLYSSLLEKNLAQDEIFSADFGRLASGFFLANSDNFDYREMIQRDDKNISIGKMTGIFSWYDPFELYTLSDFEKKFCLTQITSGSMYLSHENDGTITLYSTDMVAELVFLDQGEEKTKMILFPGMYFRFDPSLNKDMKDADLLRIIQVQQGSDKNTAISFINPRIEVQNSDKDRILPFVLASQKKVGALFDFLRAASMDRVQTVDSLKNYVTNSKNNFGSDTADIVNPTKKMHRLLGELQIIFSRAVNEEIDVEEFRTKTQEILEKTEAFSKNNTARKMIEQFLIDGRFALFMGENTENSHYQKLYDEAADILNINPTTGKGKMFQVLSNIFSKNLLEDKMSNNQMGIDVIGILNNTVTQSQSEILVSDYFDISLYSFLILRMMPDVQNPMLAKNAQTSQADLQSQRMSLGKNIFETMLLSRTTLERDALYRIYKTIFSSTQRYVAGLTNSQQIANAQGALSEAFYEPMLHLLVNSLYQTYTTIEDGEIHLSNSFVNRGVPELSSYNHKEIVANISQIHTIMQEIFEKKIKNSQDKNALRTRNDIEKDLAHLK